MWTPAGRAFLVAGLVLAGLGVLFGNVAFLAAATFPTLLALGARAERPRRVGAARAASTIEPRRGDVVRITVEVHLPKGRGHVECWSRLPEEVELVEGSNLRLLPLGRRARTEAFAFAFRATRRGPIDLAPLRLEWHDPLGLVQPLATEGGGPLRLEVRPRMPYLRRVASVRTAATRFVPEGDPSPVGPPGTDFHEIRDYAWGDPPKSINWKATARRLSRGEGAIPLVNEYVREGKKTVWLFVDAGAAMEVGTNLDTALEHAVEAAGAVARHYLDRGFAVGLAPYDATTQDVLWPDYGRRQLRRILRKVAELEAGPPEGLEAAVDRARRYFRGGRPMAVVLTRLVEPGEATATGIRRLVGAVARGRRGPAPVFVVDTRPWNALERDEAPLVVDALDAPVAALVRSEGARVVPWRPGRERFEAAFLVGLKPRGGGVARVAGGRAR